MIVDETRGMSEGSVMARGSTATETGRGSAMTGTPEVEGGEDMTMIENEVNVVGGGTTMVELAGTPTRIETDDLGMTRKPTPSR